MARQIPGDSNDVIGIQIFRGALQIRRIHTGHTARYEHLHRV